MLYLNPDHSAGVVTGTVTAVVGLYKFAITAANGAGSVSTTLYFEVQDGMCRLTVFTCRLQHLHAFMLRCCKTRHFSHFTSTQNVSLITINDFFAMLIAVSQRLLASHTEPVP